MAILNMQVTAPQVGAVGLSAAKTTWTATRLFWASVRRFPAWVVTWLFWAFLTATWAYARPATVWLVAIALTPSLIRAVARRYAPHQWERWVSQPWRRFVWRTMWRRRWHGLSEALGLGQSFTRTHTDKETGRTTSTDHWKPTKAKVKTTATGLSVIINTPRGKDDAAVIDALPAIAADLGSLRHEVDRTPGPSGWVKVAFCMIPILNTVRAWQGRVSALGVVVGRDEMGAEVLINLFASTHLAVQGGTQSGKSNFVYALLRYYAGRRDALICGIDPSGVLLSPWRAITDHPELIACGTEDMTRAADVADRLVDLMTARLRMLDDLRIDNMAGRYSSELPLIIVVLEEWPGAQLAAKAEDTKHGRKAIEAVNAVIQSAMLRLGQEGLKVGIRLVIMGQRLSEKAINTDLRSQFGIRISMKLDNAEGLGMLHAAAVCAAHAPDMEFWAPGVGLITQPGKPTRRFRADRCTYEAYRSDIESAAGAALVEQAIEFVQSAPAPAPASTPAPEITKIDPDDPATWPVITDDETLSARSGQ